MVEATIKKVAEQLSGKYYEVVVPKGRKDFVKVARWYTLTEEEILNNYLVAKLPSYLEDVKEDIYTNPLRLFRLCVYSFGAELECSCMSAWEYDALIKREKEVKDIPVGLKMAYICTDRDNRNWVINCEAYDDESMVTSKNMSYVNRWVAERKEEISRLLNLSYEIGDVLYSY